MNNIKSMIGATIYLLISMSLFSTVYACDGDCDIPGDDISDFNPDIPEYSPEIQIETGVKFGEQHDLYTGEISFRQVDISIPGNFNIPVEVSRSFVPGGRLKTYNRAFHTWSIDVPYISTEVIKHATIQNTSLSPSDRAEPWHVNRCSGGLGSPVRHHPNAQSVNDILPPFQSGVFLSVPGEGDKRLATPKSISEFSGVDVNYSTRDYWKVTCLPQLKQGRGEGFLVKSPDGLTYKFDVLVYIWDESRYHYIDPYVTGGYGVLFVSEISDVSGNWVKFDYGSNGVTKIYSSDYRQINFSYSSDGLLNSASINGKVWQYSQNQGVLTVTLPDQREWKLGLKSPYHSSDSLLCESKENYDAGYIINPDGLRIDYEGRIIERGRKNSHPKFNAYVHDLVSCEKTLLLNRPALYSKALIKKKVTDLDGSVLEWSYQYEEDDGSYEGSGEQISDTIRRYIVRPDGSKIEKSYYRTCDWREGLLYKEAILNGSNSAELEKVYSYVKGHALFTPTQCLKTNYQSFSNLNYLKKIVLKTGLNSYTTDFEYITNPQSSLFSFGKPYRVVKYSTLSTASRSSDYTYKNIKDSWILSLEEARTDNGKLIKKNVFDSKGRVISVEEYGVKVIDFTYNTNGTVRSKRDSLGRVTDFSNYYRGRPSFTIFPDGSSALLNLSYEGWTTRLMKDGFDSKYTRTPTGRITAISKSGGWDEVVVDYSSFGSGELIEKTAGNHFTKVWKDAYGRVTKTAVGDLSQVSETVYRRYQYDALGRLVFISLPSYDSEEVNGISIDYDILGRKTAQVENSFPFRRNMYDYLSGNRIRHTDPNGNTTLFTYSGFASPDDGNVIKVSRGGVNVDIVYNIWGKTTSIRQRHYADFSLGDQTQKFFYDDKNRLCRQSVPESGDTIYKYDSESQVIGISYGNAKSETCSWIAGAKNISINYDGVGRKIHQVYQSGAGEISYFYDRNGNLIEVSNANSTLLYAYNEMNLINHEQMLLNGKVYTTEYEYDGLGNVTSLIYPSGRKISFDVDASGRTRSIAGYLTGVSYDPSGEISEIRYSNGLTQRINFNDRSIPESLYIKSSSGVNVVGLAFEYDANLNTTLIEDKIDASYTNRMSYDSLDRLVAASGKWGAGSMSYDALSNIKRMTVGSSTLNYNYDVINRLQSLSGSETRQFNYDSFGNLTNNGLRAFEYDDHNQIKKSGTVSFYYDGKGHRVMKDAASLDTYYFYSNKGQLIFSEDSSGKKTEYIYLDDRLIAKNQFTNDLCSTIPRVPSLQMASHGARQLSSSSTEVIGFSNNLDYENYESISWVNDGIYTTRFEYKVDHKLDSLDIGWTYFKTYGVGVGSGELDYMLFPITNENVPDYPNGSSSNRGNFTKLYFRVRYEGCGRAGEWSYLNPIFIFHND